MKRVLALMSVAALVLLAACGSDDAQTTTGEGSNEASAGEPGSDSKESKGSTSKGTLEVTTEDFSFVPSSLKADPGSKVTIVLTNKDSAEHSFTIEELDVEAEAHGGETAEDTFTAAAGTYEFFCEYHPDDMRGTLVVGSGAGGGSSPTEDSGGDDPNNPNY